MLHSRIHPVIVCQKTGNLPNLPRENQFLNPPTEHAYTKRI